MVIKVLVFGQIADSVGKRELDLSDIKSTDDLMEKLEEKIPGINKLKYAIAVNKKLINENVTLNGNEIIAILPAFSGG